MVNKQTIKKNIDLQNEYQSLLNFVKESRYGSVIFDLTINHKNLFSDKWNVYRKKKEISKDAMINILEELIKRQDKEFKKLMKEGKNND